MDNPRLVFDVLEPSPAVHQDNKWRQPLRFDPQEIPFESSIVRYLATQGRTTLHTSHHTMVNQAIEFDTRTPEIATKAARSQRALGCEALARAEKYILKRKNRSDFTRLAWQQDGAV